MKKIFTILGLFTVLFTLAGCQKEQTNVLRATISHYQSDSKVYIDNKVAYWHVSDQIWINGITSTGLQTLDDSHFEILMPASFEPTAGDTLNAVYPDSVVTGSLSDNTVGITLPATQAYETDADGRQIVKAPMVAQATVNDRGGADVAFSNVCSLLQVRVHPHVFVHTITVSQAPDATNHPSLAGSGTITFGSDPTLQMAANGSQTITLNVEASREDGIFYIVIPPYTDETKLIVTVFDNPQTTIIRGQQANHALPQNKIAVIDCIDNGRGLFSVSATDKVSFARGNLTGTSGSYSFTTNQYDLGSTYTQANISDYSAAMGPEWFILSQEQWAYLLARADNLKVRCELDGVKGLVLLPDNWFNGLYTGTINVTDGQNMNGLSLTEWQELERYGAVFLPAISATSQNHNYYWTSTNGYAVAFGSGEGQGGTGQVIELSSGSARIRHAHYVVQGGSSTNE